MSASLTELRRILYEAAQERGNPTPMNYSSLGDYCEAWIRLAETVLGDEPRELRETIAEEIAREDWRVWHALAEREEVES